MGMTIKEIRQKIQKLEIRLDSVDDDDSDDTYDSLMDDIAALYILLPEDHPPKVDNSDREWKEEMAREEGMLHGIDAYNDWMGY